MADRCACQGYDLFRTETQVIDTYQLLVYQVAENAVSIQQIDIDQISCVVVPNLPALWPSMRVLTIDQKEFAVVALDNKKNSN